MFRQLMIPLALVLMVFGLVTSAARAGDPPSLSGPSRDAYDRAIDRGFGRSPDAYERAADRVFGGARREAFRELDSRTREIVDRMDRAGSGHSHTAGVGFGTSALCAVETYGVSFGVCLGGFSACKAGPGACVGGIAACIESVSQADEKFQQCIERNKAPSGGHDRTDHGGRSPAGSTAGAGAATGL